MIVSNGMFRYCITMNEWIEPKNGTLILCDKAISQGKHGCGPCHFRWIPSPVNGTASTGISSSSHMNGSLLYYNDRDRTHHDYYMSLSTPRSAIASSASLSLSSSKNNHSVSGGSGGSAVTSSIICYAMSSFPLRLIKRFCDHMKETYSYTNHFGQCEKIPPTFPFIHSCIYHCNHTATSYVYHWRLLPSYEYRTKGTYMAPIGGTRMNLTTGLWSSVASPIIDQIHPRYFGGYGESERWARMIPFDGHGILYLAHASGGGGYSQWYDMNNDIWHSITHWVAHGLVHTLDTYTTCRVIWDRDLINHHHHHHDDRKGDDTHDDGSSVTSTKKSRGGSDGFTIVLGASQRTQFQCHFPSITSMVYVDASSFPTHPYQCQQQHELNVPL